MLTSSGSGAIRPVRLSKLYYSTPEREAAPHQASAHNYDSVSLSGASSKGSRFHMDLVSRLSQEVRTATTTGDIQALRREVSSGQYTPDPMAIAARILFLGEDA